MTRLPPPAEFVSSYTRPQFGLTRIWAFLRREGWRVKKKWARRLYRLDGPQLRMRVCRRRHMDLYRYPAPQLAGPTDRWSMDFVQDALIHGRPFRVLTAIDHSPRETRGVFHRSVNGHLRDECLNVRQFTSLPDAQAKIEAWRVDSNQRRPHSSLGRLTTNECTEQRQNRVVEVGAFSASGLLR